MKGFGWWLLGSLALAGIISGASALYIMFYEPDRAAYPLRGIDVSHHQKEIDWRKVAQDDVAFAFIKATEGGDHRDTRFAKNWREAQAAGLKVGAYHFLTFCRSGLAQAKNFLRTLGPDKGTLPAALDLEFGGNCSAVPSPAEMRVKIDSFLALVESHTGKPTVLYVTPEFWDAYKDHLPQRPLWVRSLFRRPGPDQPVWSVWQYHNAGSVDGIDEGVDLNVVRDMKALTQ